MFTKAIEDFQRAQTRKESTSLAQQLFPSSSPHAARPSQQQPLRPSASSLTNAPGLDKNRHFTKRTFNSPSTMPTGTRSYATASNARSGDSNESIVGKLHELVQFDENDFVDDADLDLDAVSSPAQPRLPAAFPRKSSQPTAASACSPNKLRTDPASSFPLRTSQVPWSSSPPEHSMTPAGAKDVYYPKLPVVDPPKAEFLESARPSASDNQVQYPQMPLSQSNHQRMSRPREEETESASQAKRRKLPWSEQQAPQEEPRPRSADQRTHCQVPAANSRITAPATTSTTPLPKAKAVKTAAWNKTASALKEDQRRFRQQASAKLPAKVNPAERSNITKTSTKVKKVPKFFLSDEQNKVLNLVAEGKKSVFFTGSAGTGKSVLMREIISKLRQKHAREPDRVAVTASTGLAACNIGGVTLHSFAGIGLGKEPVEQLVKKVKRNQKTKMRWMRTRCLIVDEISMVDGDLFDKLEHVARIIRNNGRPFGGIQLIVTGDFFQLPPVPDYGKVAKFAFDAETWSTSIQHTIGLTHVYRQKDEEFAGMLNEMRLGKLSPQSIAKFRALCRKASEYDYDATELFPTRNEVASANAMRMRLLSGTTIDYVAQDGGTMQDEEQRTKLLSNCMAESQLTLKKGAQVMLIKNIDDSLVNGSIGKIIAFMSEKEYDHYHESEADFQGLEKPGPECEASTTARKDIKNMAYKGNAPTTTQYWPLVRFHLADGSSRDLLCQREVWKIELPNGEITAQRSQVPLILAWALSIHKAQGQTLERVRVDLGKIFEKGQAYVALSRATTQEGLHIINFDPRKVMAHDKVRAFYESLYSVDKTGQDGVNFKRANTMSTFLDGDEAMQEAYHRR